MNVRLSGGWDKVARLLTTGPARIQGAARRALLQEGHYLRGKVVQGFTSQAPGGLPFKPLSPRTLETRRQRGFRGTKILIVTGDLRNSISVLTLHGGDAVFVGVARTARRRDSGDLQENIAATHEFGATRGTATIPARPFIGPIMEQYAPTARDRFLRRIAYLLAGDFGTMPLRGMAR